MKKKYLFLLPLLIVPLAACETNGENNDNSDDNDAPEYIDVDKEEAMNKLKEYGINTGFDITVESKADDETSTTIEVAMKGDYLWTISDGTYSGYKKETNKLVSFSSSDNGATFETYDLEEKDLNNMTIDEAFDTFFEATTAWLYFGNNYEGIGLKKNGSVTFAGRKATEYGMSISYGLEGVTYKTYIDNELGITLYWYSKATSAEEPDSDVEIKVTSFKSGAEVVVPNLQ